jgi:hypothetical protein
MQLADEVVAALIAAGVSIIASLVTYFTTKHQMSLERENLAKQLALEREKLETQLKRQFTDRLYDLRLQCYPDAFQITEGLSQVSKMAEEDLYAFYQSVKEQLKTWKEKDANLLLSDDALKMFYELRKALGKNPERGAVYSDAQKEKIWRARNRFRAALRGDLGLLFEEDEES